MQSLRFNVANFLERDHQSMVSEALSTQEGLRPRHAQGNRFFQRNRAVVMCAIQLCSTASHTFCTPSSRGSKFMDHPTSCYADFAVSTSLFSPAILTTCAMVMEDFASATFSLVCNVPLRWQVENEVAVAAPFVRQLWHPLCQPR